MRTTRSGWTAMRAAAATFAAAGATATMTAHATEAPLSVATPSSRGAAPSGGEVDSVVANLIRLLVQQKVITQEAADALLAQARAEAARARAAGAATGGVSGAATGAPGDVRVTYVPEPVRRQIRDELKQEVLAQAKEENWATPNELPEWTKRFDLFGRVRARYQHLGYADNNTNQLVDFNDINSGSPVDLSPGAAPDTPYFNLSKDRNQFLLAAWLGVDAKIDDGVSATVAVATGNSNTPVSFNQTLGGVGQTGQGGNFSKYNVWLDQAYMRFKPLDGMIIDVGRAPNPFFTTELVFDSDVQFDGLSVRGERAVTERLTPFFTVGAFPVYNTNLNFSTNDTDKEGSNDRYLVGAQIGLDVEATEKIEVKAGLANYYFHNIQGQRSSLCDVINSGSSCDTDNTRPQFAQKGNTYFALRNINLNPDQSNNFQYFGLASDFNVLSFTTRTDFSHYDPIHVILETDFAANLSYDEDDIKNKNPSNNLENGDSWRGGNLAFGAMVEVGHEKIRERWDWQSFVGYRYIESDAVVDSFNDSDFHQGGTNAQGYIVGGRLGIAKNTWVTMRWLSADEVTGPPVGIDVFQFDLNTRF